jgi:hypothetical protein
MQDRQYHQVRVREQPLFGFGASRLCCPRDSSQVPVPSEAAKVIQANSRQVRHFVFGEELLARLDSDHLPLLSFSDAECTITAAMIRLQ